jgi:hypothetical protein
MVSLQLIPQESEIEHTTLAVRGGRKVAYRHKFKTFKGIFTDHPGIFKIEEWFL